MVPPDIMYCTPEEILLHEDFNTPAQLAFKAQYLLNDVLVRFHFHGDADGLLDHLDALGMDEKNVGWHEFEPHDDLIDILERDDIDPRYRRTEAPDYFVVVERLGVNHFFEYTVAEHQGRSLDDFLDELGLHRDHPMVTVHVLNLVDWEDLDDEDTVMVSVEIDED